MNPFPCEIFQSDIFKPSITFLSHLRMYGTKLGSNRFSAVELRLSIYSFINLFIYLLCTTVADISRGGGVLKVFSHGRLTWISMWNHSHLTDIIIAINAIISTEPLLLSAIIRYKQLLNPNQITDVHGRDLFQDNLNISNLICQRDLLTGVPWNPCPGSPGTLLKAYTFFILRFHSCKDKLWHAQSIKNNSSKGHCSFCVHVECFSQAFEEEVLWKKNLVAPCLLDFTHILADSSMLGKKFALIKLAAIKEGEQKRKS